MFRTSNEHVFTLLDRLHRRARHLVYGDGAADEASPGPGGAGDDDAALAAREAAALAERVDLRLPALAARLGLSELDAEVLACALLAEYDPFSRSLMRVQQREPGRPWLEVGTIADLIELPRERVPELGRALAPEAPLRRWALVERDDGAASGGAEAPLVGCRVKLAARVAQHLVGDDRMPRGMSLRPARAPGKPGEPVESAALGEGLLQRVEGAMAAGEPLVVEIVGRPHTGRHAIACAIADRLGRPLFTLDLARGVAPGRLAFRLAEARREARLAGAIPCLRNWDSLLPPALAASAADDAAGPPSAAAPRLPDELAAFLEELSGVVLLTSEESTPLLGLHVDSVSRVDVPFPSPSERARLLAAALERRGLAPARDVELSSITRRFALDPRRIEVAARAAGERARERDPAADTVLHSELVDACRHQIRHDLKSLASRVITSHRWEDLVIPVEVYHSLIEMIQYVRFAQKVYDEWGFAGRHSLSEGVSALFAGPPGTGKTMCASVVARELDMELFRVDLSRVVSKWIGETEKNLSKVFDEAQHSNAIILFDEADSLFAKRTEVKSSVDRYANLEVNFLLQRMEQFSGVTILTTNFEDTLDTAFKRRLTFRMRFEKPDADARGALWRKVFPSSCALASDFDPDALGRQYDVAGGNIRNAAVRAAFFAAAEGGPVDQEMCMRAAERESREMGLLTKVAQRRAPEPPAAEAAGEPEAPGSPVGLRRLLPGNNPGKPPAKS